MATYCPICGCDDEVPESESDPRCSMCRADVMVFSNLFKKVYVVLKSGHRTHPVAVHATEDAALRDACVRWSKDLLQKNGLSTTHQNTIQAQRGQWNRMFTSLMTIHEEVGGTSYNVSSVLYMD